MPRVSSRIDGSRVTQVTGPTPLARIQTGDRLQQDAQRQTEAGTQSARALPFGDGNLIANVAMGGGVNVDISHRLGRPYQGWIVVRLQATIATTIIEPSTLDPSLKDRLIRLKASSTCTVDLWIF